MEKKDKETKIEENLIKLSEENEEDF